MILRHPELLWLLLPVAAAILFFALRGRRIAIPAAVARVLAVGAVLVAIAGPIAPYSVSGSNVIFVVDRSGSIPPAATSVQARLIDEAMGKLGGGTRAGVIAFGGKASVVFAPGDAPRDVNRLTGALNEVANIDRDHTNVAAGLRLARALLSRGGGGQIFLLSDGQENSGDARVEAETASAEGIRISPLQSDEFLFPNDVRVALVDVPTTVWSGDTLPVRVAVTGNAPWRGTLRLAVDGQTISETLIDAPDGNGSLNTTLPNPQPGTHVVAASVQVTQGENRIPDNDTLSVVTTVRGKPGVWLIEGKAGEGKAVADNLTRLGMNVTVKAAKDIPARLSAVDADAFILVDVSAKDLTLDQMTTIQQGVRANGKGLVVLGGPNAFGGGAYYGTPLEQALPVRMGFAPGNQRDQVALGIVLDRSGSMDFGESGSRGETKIALARQGSSLSLDALKTGDEFAMVVFNDGASTVVDLQPLTENREGVRRAINGIRAEGGTDIWSGMSRMLDVMRGSTASVKHIIVMSDGESQGRSDYQTLTDQMKNLGITVSTVAIGRDADQRTMQRIAMLGGGQYYYVANVADLPRITFNEAQSAGKQPTRTGDFRAAVVKPSPIIGEIPPAELPNLDGYQVTEAKPNADVILESGQKDPILAQWQYGLGRVVAFTADGGAQFAKRWPTWSKYGQFWQQALLWALPDPNSGALNVDVHPAGDEVIIGVDATDVDGKFVNNAPVTGTLVTPDGKSFNVRLPQVGPGRYEVHVQAAAPGAYRLNVSQARTGTTPATRDGGFAVPYSPEYVASTSGTALLADVATLTGGSVLASGTAATDAGTGASAITRYREFWPYFAVAGLLLFLVDLGLRLSLAPQNTTRSRQNPFNRLLSRPRKVRRPGGGRTPPSLR